MPVTLKLDHPHFPDDTEFGISELGRIKNHGTLELDDDTVESFEASRGMTVADAFDGNGLITVTGSSLTPKIESDKSDESADTTPTTPVTPITPTVPTLVTQPEAGEQ